MEATILQFFEGIRNPTLDVFFSVFSLFGEAMFVGGVAILLYWLLPRRQGEQLIVTVLTSFPLNSFLKFTVARPRPFVAGAVSYQEPAFLADNPSPLASFPSGHAQSSSSLIVAAASTAKRVAAWGAATVLVLLVMLSRLYFGAHYPTDVLGGLLFGLAVAVFWMAVYHCAYDKRYFVLLGFAALSLVPCFLPNAAHDYIQTAGLLTGATIALLAGHFTLAEDEPVSFPRKLWRIPVGGAICAAVLAMTMLFPEGDGYSLLKWCLLAFTAIYGVRFAFERLDI